jgi:hypothetical protein
MSETTETGLVVAGQPLPSATTVAGALKQQLNAIVQAEYERRGTVQLPEDTFPLQRRLALLIERAGEYKRAFDALIKDAKQVVEDDLVEVVHETDGVPNQGLTVPDADGDVIISLDKVNTHTFDLDALHAAVAFEVLEALDLVPEVLKTLGLDSRGRSAEPEGYESDQEELESLLAGALCLAMQRLTECGKFEAQVTKVNAFTKAMARGGGESVAATVTSSHRVKSVYKGVKVERAK